MLPTSVLELNNFNASPHDTSAPNPTFEQADKEFFAHRSTSLLQRMATERKVVSLVAYLASPIECDLHYDLPNHAS